MPPRTGSPDDSWMTIGAKTRSGAPAVNRLRPSVSCMRIAIVSISKATASLGRSGVALVNSGSPGATWRRGPSLRSKPRPL
jgi:hypothetical protein